MTIALLLPIWKQPAGTQTCAIPLLSVRTAPNERVAAVALGVAVPCVVGAIWFTPICSTTTRNPMSKLLETGSRLEREAPRARLLMPFHEPPRTTREVPVAGPSG